MSCNIRDSKTNVTVPAIHLGKTCPAESDESKSIDGGAVTITLIVISVLGINGACLVFAWFVRRRWQKKAPDSRQKDPEKTVPEKALSMRKKSKKKATMEPPLPEHTVLKKDDTLKARVKELAESRELLEDEFVRLGEFVKMHVVKESEVANREENRLHNRYIDIGRKHTQQQWYTLVHSSIR
jgi:hypothetical protein